MKICALHLHLALSTALLLSSCALEELAYRPKLVDWRARAISYGKPQLWNEKHLTWSLNPAQVPNYLDRAKLERAIADSFKCWEPAGVFTFSKAAEGQSADIEIHFAVPPDGFRQGAKGCMGQACYPWTTKRGHIYLDPSEWWTTESFAVFRDPITQWLPHEIGHVLGLQHTFAPHDHTMCVHGPYQTPGEASFASLRRLYSPKTSVFLPGQIFAMENSRNPTVPVPYRPSLAMLDSAAAQ